MLRSYCLAPDNNHKLFVAVTKESGKINSKSSYNDDVADTNYGPDDFHDSIVDVSEQTENNFGRPQLSQYVGTFDENVSGSYFYKN